MVVVVYRCPNMPNNAASRCLREHHIHLLDVVDIPMYGSRIRASPSISTSDAVNTEYLAVTYVTLRVFDYRGRVPRGLEGWPRASNNFHEMCSRTTWL